MTTSRVVRTARAERDLIEIWSYIAERDPAAADRLLDRLEARWELLATQPRSGAPRDDISPGLRHLVVGQYLSLYRLTQYEVVIIRVIHGRRNITAEDVTTR
jgi:toxin ParE1/3/4